MSRALNLPTYGHVDPPSTRRDSYSSERRAATGDGRMTADASSLADLRVRITMGNPPDAVETWDQWRAVDELGDDAPGAARATSEAWVELGERLRPVRAEAGWVRSSACEASGGAHQPHVEDGKLWCSSCGTCIGVVGADFELPGRG